ncbi:MAG: alpha/beta hydrolase [Planctomycetes bacterium]|nr:alpha/beta hydrolase [Planctomycetota bacterium]
MRTPSTLALLAVVSFAACSAPTADRAPERQVRQDGADIRYLDLGASPGESTDIVVFVHGWSCDRSVWKKQLPPPDGRRYLLVDLPGHGASELPERTLSVELFARAVESVLEDAHVERAVLVGHSNGTPVIREVARRFPARVRGLVIVDGSLRPFFDDPRAGEQFVAPMQAADYRERVAAGFLDPMLAPMHSDADRAEVRERMLSTPQRTMVESFRAVLDPAVWSDEPIVVPTLALMARQPAWDEAYRAYARSLVPRLEWRDFDGVSHFLMLDDPAGFERELAAFLASLPD